MKRSFTVEAIWDDEAGVYFAKTDIIGLAIEAVTLDEFEEVLNEFAGELIIANHMTSEELASFPIKDLMPLIIWQRPVAIAA
jgi:Domain of unknown function (DUF1902)